MNEPTKSSTPLAQVTSWEVLDQNIQLQKKLIAAKRELAECLIELQIFHTLERIAKDNHIILKQFAEGEWELSVWKAFSYQDFTTVAETLKEAVKQFDEKLKS